ncbi:MAG: hypothetical protein LBK60_07485 [Verrucomicrobiales bacterium]|jgi:hypothetical protein|nr:hypothetical protein [Verrucomicrobiales bacterium]
MGFWFEMGSETPPHHQRIDAFHVLLLDGIGVDAIVDFRRRALQIPFEGKAALFVFLEPLKFTDKIKPEFRAKP